MMGYPFNPETGAPWATERATGAPGRPGWPIPDRGPDGAQDRGEAGKPAPITKPLWRMKPADRRAALRPFLDRNIRLDRWYGRVADGGDKQYEGRLVAVALNTAGSADLAIITTRSGGTTWAISLAQIYYVEAL